MMTLQSQEQFENEIWTTEQNRDRSIFVYFTAKWCGACKRLDLPSLQAEAPKALWYKCDVDENNYTPSFCDVKSLPTILCFRNKRVISRISSSTNQDVANWIKQNNN
jgi:thioredoxin-like negative regulator of GroEL